MVFFIGGLDNRRSVVGGCSQPTPDCTRDLTRGCGDPGYAQTRAPSIQIYRRCVTINA